MKETNMTEFVLENFELVADNLIEDELFKDIPIVGHAIKICKIKDGISDRIFILKLLKFFSSLNSLSEDKRNKMKKTLKTKMEERRKVSEKILLTLDNISELKKSELVAYVFISYIDEFINFEEFNRICHSINTAFYEDIIFFLEMDSLPAKSKDDYMKYLSQANLTEPHNGENYGEANQVFYRSTRIGDKFRMAYSNVKENF